LEPHQRLTFLVGIYFFNQSAPNFEFSIGPSERSSDSSSATSTPTQDCYNIEKPKSKVKYFVIKNGSLEILQEAKDSGRWSFAPKTQRSVQQAQQEGKTVVALFAIGGTGTFQGYARIGRSYQAIYSLQWIKFGDVSFTASEISKVIDCLLNVN